jgi:hypothetical protein
MYVLVHNQEVQSYPYSVDQLKRDNPDVSFPADITDEVLSNWNVFPVADTPQPPYNVHTQKVVWATPALVDGVWAHQWKIVSLSQEEIDYYLDCLVRDYDSVLNNHYDTVAQSKQYDNRTTCSMRAGYEGPYQSEAIAFAQWMDSCNQTAYIIYEQIKSGERQPFDSEQEFLDSFPELIWPST